MPDRIPPQKKDFNWGKFSKTLAFWILIILIPVAFIQLSRGGADPTPTISYTKFSQELDRDNIARITVQTGQNARRVTGDFRQRVMVDNREAKRFTLQLPSDLSDKQLQELEARNVEVEAQPERPSFLGAFMNFLPFLLIIALWIFLFKQMQAGGAKAFSFGKSRAQLLTGDTPKITFADVAGADEAKVELQEIIEFLKDPQKFTKLGGRLPKGVLLVGPPGTGKTLLARAVAGEAGRPFFSMSGSDFVE